MDVCMFVVLHDHELTHTDLKPENVLFVNSDADVMYDPHKVTTSALSLLTVTA